MSVFNDQFFYMAGVNLQARMEMNYTYTEGQAPIIDTAFRIYPVSLDDRLTFNGFTEIWFNGVGSVENYDNNITFTLVDTFLESELNSRLPITLWIFEGVDNPKVGFEFTKLIPNNIVKYAYIGYKLLSSGIYLKNDGNPEFFTNLMSNFNWFGKRDMPIRPHYHVVGTVKVLNDLILTATILSENTTLRFSNNQKTITYNGSLFTESIDGVEFYNQDFIGTSKCRYIDPINIDIVLKNIDNIVDIDYNILYIEYTLTLNNQTIITNSEYIQLKRNLITGMNTSTVVSNTLNFEPYEGKSIQIAQSIGHSIQINFPNTNSAYYFDTMTIDSFGNMINSYNAYTSSITIPNDGTNEEIALFFQNSNIARSLDIDIIYI